jgi:hypothetical protein
MAESRTTITAPGRLIFGLMTFTVVFSLVGEEIGQGQGRKETVNPFMIIFGGTVATSLLTLLSHAGEPGERFATGLAAVAFITSALVYGGPVWAAANKAFGSSPTTPVASTTPSTASTGGTAAATGVSIATNPVVLATGATA